MSYPAIGHDEAQQEKWLSNLELFRQYAIELVGWVGQELNPHFKSDIKWRNAKANYDPENNEYICSLILHDKPPSLLYWALASSRQEVGRLEFRIALENNHPRIHVNVVLHGTAHDFHKGIDTEYCSRPLNYPIHDEIWPVIAQDIRDSMLGRDRRLYWLPPESPIQPFVPRQTEAVMAPPQLKIELVP
jgi:hypothetical protein